MIAFPPGVKVWLPGGATDMRKGMNGLALLVQQGLKREPHAGELFCFRRSRPLRWCRRPRAEPLA
jgi:transposase